MPIYEYRCASCGHQLESLQKLSDAPLVECPNCHRPDLRKMVSRVGFKLKGSGWYVTDFRDIGTKPPAKSSDPPSTGTDAGAKDRPAADGAGNGVPDRADRPAPTTEGDRSAADPGSTASRGDTASGDAAPSKGSASPGGAASTGSPSDTSD
ncbi:MAG: FmdB family zinc ribbon protein [Casimicrobiaceae bacterium]